MKEAEVINKNNILVKKGVKVLIKTPEPYEDESFGGYIMRLAEYNFYPSPEYIYKLGIISSQRISSNPYKINPDLTDLEQLGVLVNLPKESLWSMLLPILSNYINPMEHIEKYKTYTHSKYFTTNNRICIECLKKTKYIKRWWDIFVVTTCPEHSCFLIDECPSCYKKLKYNRRKIDICECGFNFLNHQSEPVLDPSDLMLSKLVLKVCNYTVSDLGINNVLIYVRFEELVESILAVVRSFDNYRYVSSPNLPIKNLHNILKNALNIFKNWPNNYFSALEVLQDKNSSDNYIGIRRFGHFYQLLFGKEERHQNANLSLLREGFIEYLKSNWQYGNVDLLKNINVKDDEVKYVTLKKAADLLRKSEETIKKLFEKGVLKGTIKINKASKFYLVELSSIEEYRKIETKPKKIQRKSYDELGDFITKIDLERFLLISETTIRELVEEKIFNPTVDKTGKRIYDTKELNNFFAALNSKISRNIPYKNRHLVSFKTARALINCSYADFINYVLSSELTIIKISKKDEDVNLNQYYFIKKEILNKVKQEINGFNILELGSLLGVSRQSVQNWIKKGFFTYKMHKGKKIIKIKDVAIFKSKYIPLVHIPFINKRDCGNAVKRLSEIGILPVNGTEKDKGNGYLYIKKEVENMCGYQLNW